MCQNLSFLGNFCRHLAIFSGHTESKEKLLNLLHDLDELGVGDAMLLEHGLASQKASGSVHWILFGSDVVIVYC